MSTVYIFQQQSFRYLLHLNLQTIYHLLFTTQAIYQLLRNNRAILELLDCSYSDLNASTNNLIIWTYLTVSWVIKKDCIVASIAA